MSRHALVRAIREHVANEKEDAMQGIQLGVVVTWSPIVIDLLEGRATLDADEVTATQLVRKYHLSHTIDPGDTVVLLRKRTGGEIHWIVTDVLSDKAVTAWDLV